MKIPLFALLLSLPLAAQDLPSIAVMKSAAEAFLGGLDDTKRAKASFPFHGDARENFRFTPQTRTGLPFKEMDDAQRAAAMKLLEAALSDKGKLKTMQIMTLEGILREIEKKPDYRDPEKYYLSIFGKPGDVLGWGWKYEGHHVSLNYTIVGKEISVTPSFFGSNPGEVREGEHKGLRVLKAEEELGHAMLAVLLQSGKKEVVFTDQTPKEVLSAENRKVTALEPVGVAVADMTASQKKAMFDLISEFTNRHRPDLAAADMKKIEKAGIDKIRFGWAGSTKPGEGWYYRIQGPTFLMEAANTQNNANHVHVAWRDFDGDFGRDILAEHFRLHGKDQGGH